MIACGRRRWSRLAPAVGLAALCPLAWWTVRLPGEATTAAIALGLVTAACAVVVVARVEGLRAALGQRPAGRARRAPAGLAAVHRRGALRDPRHRAQPGHVPAPVRGRPAARRGERAADIPGLSARAALDRRRGLGAGAEHRACVRRAHAGGRGGRVRRAARAARAAWRVAARRRGAGGRARLPGRRLPGAGGVQGDDRSALRPRLRDRARRARARAPRVGAGAGRCGAAARPARDRQRLHLQLSGAALARRRVRRLGGARARARLASRRSRRRERGGPRRVAGDRRGRGPPRGRDRARDRADGRLRQLRDLQPGRRRARQPVQPPVAARGARDLAVGRLPGRTRRRRDPGARVLRGRRRRAGGARLRARLVAAPRGARGARGARRGGSRCGSMRCSAARPTRRPRRWC